MKEKENRLQRKTRERERQERKERKKGIERETDLLSISHPNTIIHSFHRIMLTKGEKIQGNLKSQTTVCTPLHVREKGKKSPSG